MKKIIVLLLGVVMMLTACSRIEVSDEEYEIVGKRMAGVLEKFDSNSKEVTTPEVINDSSKEEVVKENEPVLEVEKDSTSIQDITDKAEIVNQISSDNIDIKYIGYVVNKSYPENTTEEVYAYFEALENTKLIVLKFDLTNYSKEVQDIIHISESTSFKLLIENKYLYTPYNTLLTQDIASGKITLNPGETTQAVLVFQVQDIVVENMDKIILIITNPNKKEILAL